jgi:F420-dependent oxidoreductase-like protein
MIEGQEGLTWDRWRRLAEQVESLNLDSLFRSDHFFSNHGSVNRASLEAWVSLTALAQWTQRIQFGSLVSPMTFRHPAVLARMASAVDLLSGGRLVLGVGGGWNETEHTAYGLAFPSFGERMARLDEGIRVIRALWTGGPVDFEGSFYTLRGATSFPRPVRAAGPTLLVGGSEEKRLLRIVAEHADEWNANVQTPEEYVLKRSRLEEYCRALGRDPDLITRSWVGGVCIGRTPAEVAARAKWLDNFLTGAYGPAMKPVNVSALIRDKKWLVGTPEQVADQLRRWQQVGVQRVMLQYFDLDDMDGLSLLAEVARALN